MQVCFSSIAELDESEWEDKYRQYFRDELNLQCYEIERQKDIIQNIYRLFEEPREEVINDIRNLFKESNISGTHFEKLKVVKKDIIDNDNDDDNDQEDQVPKVIFYECINPVEGNNPPNPTWDIAARNLNRQLLRQSIQDRIDRQM